MAPTHPNTYKAFAFFEKGGPLKPIVLEWKDPAPGEVVVKVLACGVCARYVSTDSLALVTVLMLRP